MQWQQEAGHVVEVLVTGEVTGQVEHEAKQTRWVGRQGEAGGDLCSPEEGCIEPLGPISESPK